MDVPGTHINVLKVLTTYRENDIGGTFKYRAYENAELVSSKQLTAFSDYRFSSDTGDHVSLPAYVEYLRSYADKFRLNAFINLGCRVVDISPLGPSAASIYGHRVSYKKEGNEENFDCNHVAICTGLHVQPSIPSIVGIEHLKGTAIHSSSYKNRSQLEGHDVLILGCGETAMDIAYEAIKSPARSVTMCFRTGFLSFPKVLNRFKVFGKTFGGSLPIGEFAVSYYLCTISH